MIGTPPEANAGASLLRQTVAEAAAAPAEARGTSTDEVELVYFKIHEMLYALATKQVSAILGVPALTELPHAPPYLCGVLNHQGRIIAVVDVAVLDGKEPVTNAKRILVIEGAGLDAGIRVSEVIELARVDASWIEPVSASLSPPEHVIGQLRRADVACFLVDAERLLGNACKRVHGSGVTR